MKIIISPYARPLRNGNPHPKNYPHWLPVIASLRTRHVEMIQVGLSGEVALGADQFLQDQPLDTLRQLVKECDTWISVDNFWPHLVTPIKPGIVLWGQSSPACFGYPANKNLCRQGWFRPNQFRWWEDVSCLPQAFVEPEKVIQALFLG